MKTLKSSIFVFVALAFWGVLFTSCEKDEPDDPTPTISQFVSLENPYLICANRNPGGVGFDFEYKDRKSVV